MGGNVNILDPTGKSYKVDKADFRRIDRKQFTTSFINAFKILDNLHKKKFKIPLWPSRTRDALFSSGEIFNGSSEHLFNNDLTDEEINDFKPVFGDVDITVPKENFKSLFSLLHELTGQKLNASVRYIDKKAGIGGDQINCLFSYFSDKKRPINIQIDFESVDYDKDKPDEFAKFGHSSSWKDIKESIKGAFHKYLLRSISTVTSIQKDVVLLTKTSPLEPPEKIKISKVTSPVRLLSFSVTKGIVTKFSQQFLPDGTPLIVNGMKAYKEIPSSEGIRSKKEIFSILFGDQPVGNELSLMDSFLGLLQIMQDHFDDSVIEEIYLDFINYKLYGKEGQALDAKNPEGDKTAKEPAVESFKEKFPFLEKYNKKLHDLQNDYYKTYKVRSENFKLLGNLT